MTKEQLSKIIKMTNKNTDANDGETDPELLAIFVQADIARQLTIANDLMIERNKMLRDRMIADGNYPVPKTKNPKPEEDESNKT